MVPDPIQERNQTIMFRGIIVAMFTILLAMTGYIVQNINGAVDAANHRTDMLVYRINEIDRRLTTVEVKVMDDLQQ